MSATPAVPRRVFLAAYRAADAIHFAGLRRRRDVGTDMPAVGALEAAAPETAAPEIAAPETAASETAAAGAIR